MCINKWGYYTMLATDFNNSDYSCNNIFPNEEAIDEYIKKTMSCCNLCPRNCNSNRLAGQAGFCSQTSAIFAARAALHFWEEPCISGKEGSGAVFFTGCNMRCVFCQNREIAKGNIGQEISIERLSNIFLELQSQKANNINLVTPTHFIPQIAKALILAKNKGLHIPIVYNTSSYENIDHLKMLKGLVDIYLPDLKYFSTELSAQYSSASNYFGIATKAISEMYNQVGSPVFDSSNSLMKKGVIVRHLLLPGNTKDTKKILRFLHETYRNNIYVSIMNQYTPLSHVKDLEALNRKVTEQEYERVLKFARQIGIENGFIQEGSSADESFIPLFDFEGIL